MDKGLYIAVFRLPRRLRLRVGALGTFLFQPGVYLYVGSAQRSRAARLRRHARRHKPLRWHIDYLSTKATMLGAVLLPGTRRRECALAGRLAKTLRLAVPDFGSTDCRCGGHLFFATRRKRQRRPADDDARSLAGSLDLTRGRRVPLPGVKDRGGR